MTSISSITPVVNPAPSALPAVTETAFLLALRSFLNDWPKITKEDVTASALLIREHYVLSRASTSGPCIACSKPMNYDGLCPMHKSKGDEWLVSFLEKWERVKALDMDQLAFRITDVRVTTTREGLKLDSFRVNGYSDATVYPYLCADCWNEGVLPAVNDERLAQHEVLQSSREQQRAHEDRLLSGAAYTTPARRFYILNCRLRGDYGREYSRELVRMSYKCFLQTDYWQIVRGKVLYDRGSACELCSSRDALNVHHRTYEYHGEEHSHLESLVLLCQPCHAKFHDKLPQAMTAGSEAAK